MFNGFERRLRSIGEGISLRETRMKRGVVWRFLDGALQGRNGVERLCRVTGGSGARRLSEAVCGEEPERPDEQNPSCHLRHLRFFVSQRSDANRPMVTSSDASNAYRIGVTAMLLKRY